MKSKVTIEWDFNDNSPMILVRNESSDDVRDKLVDQFRHRMHYSSNWCRLDFIESREGVCTFIIKPIGDFNEMKRESELFSETFRIMQENRKNQLETID